LLGLYSIRDFVLFGIMSMHDAVHWHDGIAADFDGKYRSSRTFEERYKVWAETIIRYSHPSHRVLDAGCGSGVFSLLAAEHNLTVLGADASPPMLRLCRLKQERQNSRNATFLQIRIEQLEPADIGRFDLIVCSSVLEYVDDLWASIHRLTELLVPGGVLLLSLPNASSWYRKLERLIFRIIGRPRYLAYVRHLAEFGSMRRELRARGLNVVDVRFYGSPPFLANVMRAIGPEESATLMLLVCMRASAPDQAA
jgi:2-polyprenyl-3-methyl-5-hydroxy-6-metoxy-1,4-benzoquinol methylase